MLIEDTVTSDGRMPFIGVSAVNCLGVKSRGIRLVTL